MDIPLKETNEFVNRAFEMFSKLGEIEAYKSLCEEFKDFSRPEIDELLRRFKSIKELAFELGNKIHDNHCSRETALVELKNRFPGFPEALYQNAISRGLFESMW